MSQPPKPFGVFTIREGKDEREFWVRIGSAFRHGKDGGFTIQLDALPLDGRLVIRPPKEDAPKPGAD